MPAPISLLHGVATTAAIWDRVLPLLTGLDVRAIERPRTGDLERELELLSPLVEGSLVVGISGGATLAVALASSDLVLAGMIAHEPAVGSLVPGLLAPIAAAYAERGVEGFGLALYGPTWSIEMAGPYSGSVGPELAMFRSFEPAAPHAGQGPVLTTVGELSPEVRHYAATALHEQLDYPVEALPGAAHFAAWDAASVLADIIRRTAEAL